VIDSAMIELKNVDESNKRFKSNVAVQMTRFIIDFKNNHD